MFVSVSSIESFYPSTRMSVWVCVRGQSSFVVVVYTHFSLLHVRAKIHSFN